MIRRFFLTLVLLASLVGVAPASAIPIPVTISPRVAFVGDSYTEAEGHEHDRWSTQVAQILGWDEYNLGIGGTGYVTSIIYQGVFYPAYKDRVAEIASYAPDIVVISGGRNDLPVDQATFTTGATAFLNDLNAALPNARIIVVLPYGDDDPFPTWMHLPLVSATAAIGGCSPNIHDPLLGHPEWVHSDGIHPNSLGHTAIANAFIAAYQDLLPGSCINPPIYPRPRRPLPTTPPMP